MGSVLSILLLLTGLVLLMGLSAVSVIALVAKRSRNTQLPRSNSTSEANSECLDAWKEAGKTD